MRVRGRTRNGVGFLTVVLILAFEALDVVTGLNADGVALLEFKKGITSDPQNALQGWTSSDATPCLWSGITCIRIQSTMEDRVVGIALPRRALGGTISPKLGDLGYLATVSLHTNNLTGQIPAELFKASALARVYLSENDLTGAIPPEIRNLGQQLRVLELWGNRLTSLPTEIISCYRLRRLILSNNNITGTIPFGMGSQFTQLERLDLSVNRFTGAIPDDFGNLTSLQPQVPLNLSNNLLSGAIPPSLANLQRVPIDLSNNQLSGPIPSDSYFQSQGPPAYIGNAALCGSPLTIDCAPSPSPSPSIVASDVTAAAGTGTNSSEERGLSKAAIIGIAVGCAITGFTLMATAVLYFLMRKLHSSKNNLSLQSPRRGNSRSSLRGCLCSWRESANGAMSAEDDDQVDLVHLSGVLSFNLEELLRASAYVLGKSGVGIVYKAVLDEGTVVAVRRLGEGGEQKQKEFIAEAKSISQVRHPNVVTLHSYSWTADEKLLVYDYLPNGSLETALHGSSDGFKGALAWDARLRIARGAAQGIAHIHECGPRKYIHGDIKPANILLDAFLEARIADFGLQRLLSLSEPERVRELGSARGDTGRASSVSPAPEFGTPQGAHTVAPLLTKVYQAPEATNAKRPSQTSDVYSFGVVLLELLTGRSPFKQLTAGQHDLVSWIRYALQQKKPLSEVFDPALLNGDDDNQSKMIETLQVALACIAVNPDSRPKMKQVAEFFQQLAK